MLLNTCFLIDSLKRDPATVKFASKHAQAEFFICPIIVGEFLVPYSASPGQFEFFLSSFEVLPIDEAVSHHYAHLVSTLGRQNNVGGVNDVWIAATALAHGMPVVSRNTRDFVKFPGLRVISY